MPFCKSLSFFVAPFLLGTAALAQSAYHTEPAASSTTVINACFNKLDGFTRIVKDKNDCLRSESFVSWNIRGAVGAAGPQGLNGVPGSQGIAGLKGATGANGAPGAAGLPGAAGKVGPAGPVGGLGATGLAGAIGPVGPTGGSGVAGPIGPAGPTGGLGPIGPPGGVGAIGPIGLTGGSGVAGPTGPAGPKGNPGNNLALTANLNTLSLDISTDGKAVQPPIAFTTILMTPGDQTCLIGSVVLSVQNFAIGDPNAPYSLPALGQTLAISQFSLLYAMIGTTYGGDGISTFKLPNLQPFTPTGLQYSICTNGTP